MPNPPWVEWHLGLWSVYSAHPGLCAPPTLGCVPHPPRLHAQPTLGCGSLASTLATGSFFKCCSLLYPSLGPLFSLSLPGDLLLMSWFRGWRLGSRPCLSELESSCFSLRLLPTLQPWGSSREHKLLVLGMVGSKPPSSSLCRESVREQHLKQLARKNVLN